MKLIVLLVITMSITELQMASSSGISSDIPDDFKTEDNLKLSTSGNIQTDQCEINKTGDDLNKNLKDIVPGFQICEEVFRSRHSYLDERCDLIKNKLDKCKEILEGHESLKTQIKHINVLIGELTSCRENVSTLRYGHMHLKKDFGNCLFVMKSAGEGLLTYYKHMNSLLVRCEQLVNEKRQYLNEDILKMLRKELRECKNILWQRMEEEFATVAILMDKPKIEEDQSKLETLNQQLKTITENFETLKRQHKIDQMRYKELSDKFNSTVKELEEYSKKYKPEPDIDIEDLKSQLAKTQAKLNLMVKQQQILLEKYNNLITRHQRLTEEHEELKQSLQEQHEINFAHDEQVKAVEHLQTKEIKEPVSVSEIILHSKDKESHLDRFKIGEEDSVTFDNDLQYFDADSKESMRESLETETKQILSEENKVVEDSILADDLLLHDVSKKTSKELKVTFEDDVFPKTYFTESDDKKENEYDMSGICVHVLERKQSRCDGKICIEINDLILQPYSDAMLNPRIKGFYIVYEFLGHRGAHMETPETINIKDAVNGKFTFNFRREFSVDPLTHPEQNFLLTNMLDSTKEDLHKIHFEVVGEHLDDNLPGYKWTDVGYADLDMMTLISFPGDHTVVDLSVVTLIKRDIIGTLWITVDGINVIKNVATNETINSK